MTLTASMVRRIAIHPSKRTLHLWSNSYWRTKMVCSANEFLRLDFLDVCNLRELKEWQIEEGAMPCLETLSLRKMAEAIVSLAVERISDLLIHEAGFLLGVRDEVERLKDELLRMQCFLKDADRKKNQNERLRN
ncbi:Rx [Theobroma cacao]|nr:Rx [Theobroma cacao]